MGRAGYSRDISRDFGCRYFGAAGAASPPGMPGMLMPGIDIPGGIPGIPPPAGGFAGADSVALS